MMVLEGGDLMVGGFGGLVLGLYLRRRELVPIYCSLDMVVCTVEQVCREDCQDDG